MAVREAGVSAEVTWALHAFDTDTGHELLDENSDATLPCASIGKILLLIETARRFSDGTLDPDEPLTRSPQDAVRDSGIWQDLRVSTLPAADVAALVATVSDNLATNVLVRTVGLDAVAGTARQLGIDDVVLHDRVRDEPRGHAVPHLATASARGLTHLFVRLLRGELVSPEVSQLVLSWLSGNTDLSMVPATWALDPLAHRAHDRPPVMLVNKTGTDAGVRADAGLVTIGRRSVAYAVLAHWPAPTASRSRDGAIGVAPERHVLSRMHDVGRELLHALRELENPDTLRTLEDPDALRELPDALGDR